MMLIRHLGTQPYDAVWQAMKSFTLERHDNTPDECWMLQHFPVYTQGQAGKAEHILNPGNIPVIQSDRGGQVTYHGPGQLVSYILMDIHRKNLGVRSLVRQLEGCLISLLNEYAIEGVARCDAPGVYVDDKKIASIGLRVKNGCTYHGIALNVAMDLSPFNGINPCGFARMQMAQMQDYVEDINMDTVTSRLADIISKQFEA